MFDVIDEDLFADAVWEHFSVLDQRYVADQCKELLPRLRATFDGAFETCFVILDSETGKPMNVNAVLKSREAAEEFLNILGCEKYEIGMLVRER